MSGQDRDQGRAAAQPERLQRPVSAGGPRADILALQRSVVNKAVADALSANDHGGESIAVQLMPRVRFGPLTQFRERRQRKAAANKAYGPRKEAAWNQVISQYPQLSKKEQKKKVDEILWGVGDAADVRATEIAADTDNGGGGINFATRDFVRKPQTLSPAFFTTANPGDYHAVSDLDEDEDEG